MLHFFGLLVFPSPRPAVRAGARGRPRHWACCIAGPRLLSVGCHSVTEPCSDIPMRIAINNEGEQMRKKHISHLREFMKCNEMKSREPTPQATRAYIHITRPLTDQSSHRLVHNITLAQRRIRQRTRLQGAHCRSYAGPYSVHPSSSANGSIWRGWRTDFGSGSYVYCEPWCCAVTNPAVRAPG